MTARNPIHKPVTDAQDLARQIQTEHSILRNVEQALTAALGWETFGGSNTRKLSTLQFVAHSFERHWSRMRTLAEHGGYLSLVVETKPHLSETVSSLKDRCHALGQRFAQSLATLDQVSPDDTAAFDKVCADLIQLLEDRRAIDEEETHLFQLAIGQDEGGRG
jgi:hypothetical protein